MPELTLSADHVEQIIDETSINFDDAELQPRTMLPPENYIKQYLQHMLAEPLDFSTQDDDAMWQSATVFLENNKNNVRCFDLAPVVETNALYWWSYQGLLSTVEIRHLLYRQFLQVLVLSYRLGSQRVRQATIAECRHIWATLEDIARYSAQDH